MSKFENVAVPMRRLPDGRDLIPDIELARQPEFADFVSQFSNYWQRDDRLCGFVSPRE